MHPFPILVEGKSYYFTMGLNLGYRNIFRHNIFYIIVSIVEFGFTIANNSFLEVTIMLIMVS